MSTVSIGGVILNPSLQWPKQRSTTSIAQVITRTVGGKLVVFQQALHAGVEIDLEATEDTGWLTYDMVRDLLALAATAQPYTLVYRDVTLEVIFRYTSGAAVDMEPLLPRAIPLDTDPFTGTIRLLTV